jgi:hypothetical protein
MKAFGAKHLLSLLMGGAFLGSTALGEYGKAGERGLAREQIELQKLLGVAKAETSKRMTKESRAATEKYTKSLLKAKRDERRQARELALMESFSRSQDRQMALILQAVQGIASQPTGAPSRTAGGSGMLGLMRSSL